MGQGNIKYRKVKRTPQTGENAGICFLVVDHILGFLVETISWSKIRRCWPLVLLKMVAHGYFQGRSWLFS